MIKNHFKIAWRNLKTDRLFSMINIIGLSLGVAIALVLFAFIDHELSFDRFTDGKPNVYRVLLHTEGETFGKEIWANVPAALAPAMKEEIPNVEHTARILKNGFGENAYVNVDNRNLVESGLYWCDAEILDILQINFLRGNREELGRPKTIALSETTAQRYFGTVDPIGKSLTIDNRIDLEIVGVYKNLPKNSSYDFNTIARLSPHFCPQFAAPVVQRKPRKFLY